MAENKNIRVQMAQFRAMPYNAEMTTNVPTTRSPAAERPRRHHVGNEAATMTLSPPRKQRGAQQLAPGYLWNSTTQELIPILPEDHSDYRENAETIKAAVRRWESRK
jgi:hypothetical protein